MCFDCELFYLTSTIRNLNAVFYVIPQCKGMKFITNMKLKNIFFHLLFKEKAFVWKVYSVGRALFSDGDTTPEDGEACQ